jgi:hypothetical protein
MGTSHKRRIGSREAEQLLTADPDAAAHPGLSRLLAAAAAPPRPDELTGLHLAMAAFEAAGRNDQPSVAPARARRVFVRSLTVKAAAGIAVVLFGGTALAAETGNLPGGSQQRAHDLFSALGVPPPDARATPAVPPAAPPAAPGSRTATSSPRPAASSGGPTTTPGPAGEAMAGLCRSWVARQKNPQHKALKAEALRKLAAAAGGEQQIAAFCAAVLAEGPAPTTAPAQTPAPSQTPAPTETPTQSPGPVAPTTSHPGSGKGHTKTPNPHKKKG